MGDEETRGPGFTVVDRRGSSGEDEAADPAASPAQPEEALRVDFSGFCLSLATAALYHMGIAIHPESQDPAPERNLPLARQTIDTLHLLQEKTRGNLDEEEAKLLEGLLYELHMRFVEASTPASGSSE